MTLIKARSEGFTKKTRLLYSELDTFQNEIVKAIDGYNGGNYNSNNNLSIGVGGGTGVVFSNTSLYPSVTNTLKLGKTDGYFNDGYISNLHSNQLLLDKTVTATVGDATINKISGRCILTAGQSTVTILNSYISINSIIIISIAIVDATATSAVVVAGPGWFVITANNTATSNTPINFLVIN
jgi:hypothetical protein